MSLSRKNALTSAKDRATSPVLEQTDRSIERGKETDTVLSAAPPDRLNLRPAVVSLSPIYEAVTRSFAVGNGARSVMGRTSWWESPRYALSSARSGWCSHHTQRGYGPSWPVLAQRFSGTGPIMVGYLYAATGGWMAPCISHGTRKDIQQ
jgi:hypothetical protein